MCATNGSNEADYMSDVFLQCDETETVGEKRKSEAVNKLSKKKITAMMSATIEVGMNRPIEETNKGYKLLEKFGYKGGTADSQTNGNPNAAASAGGSSLDEGDRSLTAKSSTAPLRFVMRDSTYKGGIGKPSVCANDAQNVEVIDKKRSQEAQAQLQGQFVSEQALRLKWRDEVSLLRRVKLLAHELDYKRDPGEAGEEGPGEEQEPTNRSLGELQEQVAGVIDYLRAVHHYCVHCGCQFESDADLSESCPGPALDNH